MSKFKNYQTYCKSLPIELRDCKRICLHTKGDKIFLLDTVDLYWDSLPQDQKSEFIYSTKSEPQTKSIIVYFENIKPRELKTTSFDTIFYFSGDGELSGYTLFGGIQDISVFQDFTIEFNNNIIDTTDINAEFSFYIETGEESETTDVNDVKKDDISDYELRHYLPKNEIIIEKEVSNIFSNVDKYIHYTDDVSDLLGDPNYSIITDQGTITGDFKYYSVSLGSGLKYGHLDYNKITVINNDIVLYSINTETGDYSVTSIDHINYYNRPQYKYFYGTLKEIPIKGIKSIASRYIILKDNTCYNVESKKFVENKDFYKYLNSWYSRLELEIDINKFPINVSEFEFSRRIGEWYVYSRDEDYEYFVSLSGVVQINPKLEIAYPLNDKTIMVESIEKVQIGETSEQKRVLTFYFPQNGELIKSLGCYDRSTFTSLSPSISGSYTSSIYIPNVNLDSEGNNISNLYYGKYKIISEYRLDSSLFDGLRHKKRTLSFIPGYNITDLFWENTTDYSDGRIIDTFRGYIFYIDKNYLHYI